MNATNAAILYIEVSPVVIETRVSRWAVEVGE